MKRLHIHLGWLDLVLLSLALLSIVLTGAQLASNWKSEEDTRQQAALHQAEYSTTEDLEDLLIQAEASQRGYLLFGRKTYLEPYFSAVHELPAVIERMEKMRSAG